MAQRKGTEYVPSAPFACWLNRRLAELARSKEGDLNGATFALAVECGWGDQSDYGARKLYRCRKELRDGSKNSRKGPVKTDYFPRALVEDALHNAGVSFEDMYPEIVARERVELEPEMWCLRCEEMKTPIDGLCPFCETRIGPKTGQALQGKRLRKAA